MLRAGPGGWGEGCLPHSGKRCGDFNVSPSFCETISARHTKAREDGGGFGGTFSRLRAEAASVRVAPGGLATPAGIQMRAKSPADTGNDTEFRGQRAGEQEHQGRSAERAVHL